MIPNDHIDLEGMLKLTSVFPEDSFTLKTVTLDNTLPNLESLHDGHAGIPNSTTEDKGILKNPTWWPIKEARYWWRLYPGLTSGKKKDNPANLLERIYFRNMHAIWIYWGFSRDQSGILNHLLNEHNEEISQDQSNRIIRSNQDFHERLVPNNAISWK